jgi:hypothetical protein
MDVSEEEEEMHGSGNAQSLLTGGGHSRHNRIMKRILKFLLSALLALALLFAAAAGALAWWLSGDGPRERVQVLASEKLGVPVTLSQLSLSVLPWPSVAVGDVKFATQAPLTAERMELRPAWRKLLGFGGAARELEVESLTLRGLSLPQKGIDQLTQTLSKAEHSAQQIRRVTAQNASKTEEKTGENAAVVIGLLAIPQRTRLDGVVWTSGAGESLSLSGDVSLNAARDQMDLNLQLAGGSVRGPLRLAAQAGKAGWQLRGELATSGVDLAQLPGARQRMAGRLQGTTTLDASAAQLSGIGAALQTQTQFNVSGAVIKGIDLAKAVRTLGLSRGGETALQQLSGNLVTRGTGAPMQITLSDLQAKSSILVAKGAVSIGAAASPGAPRALSGKVDVDLTAGDGKLGQVVDKTVGQLVGIPLEISGTTATPQVQPTRGAMIGGAIGSVVAPVIGTGAGAKMGDRAAKTLEGWKDKLFGK